MFEQSFTFSVVTDANGCFHSAQAVSSPFALDVKITATLKSPEGVTVQASFELAAAGERSATPKPREFTASAGETVDLGKWAVVAGDDANTATAVGRTEPAAAETEVVVEFVAAPSFF